MRKDSVLLIAVVLACVLHLGLAGGLLLTNLPLCDEGFYGIPAHSLESSGSLRNPVMESSGVAYLKGIDRVFYWMAPIGMLIQAAAFRLFGFSLFAQRAVSVLCGAGTVVAWFYAMRCLFERQVAALSSAILAVDVVFCSLASRGRADMMSLFFGCLGLAFYLNLRERSLRGALWGGHCGCAIAGLIHPLGGIVAFLSMAVLMIGLERDRLRFVDFCFAASPYALFGIAWAAYIAKDPSLFVAQFIGNIRNRTLTPGGFDPAQAFHGETLRYMAAFGIDALSGIRGLRILVPLSYLTSIMGCAILVRSSWRHVSLLLFLLAGSVLAVAAIEGSRQGWYVLYTIPVLSSLLAVWIAYLWKQENRPLHWLGVAQMTIALMAAASSVATIRNRHYQDVYQPLMNFLNTNVQQGDLVFGRSELYFDLQCRTCLRDDERLGANSGRRADFVVLDSDYRENIAGFAKTEGRTYGYIKNELGSEYLPVFHNAGYEVLRRKENAAGAHRNRP